VRFLIVPAVAGAAIGVRLKRAASPVETQRMGRVVVVACIAALAAVGCGGASEPDTTKQPAVSVETPATADGLARARTTFERALERADTATVRALIANECLAGEMGRELDAELDRLKPREVRATIRVATRNVTRERGEVRIRTHFAQPGTDDRGRASGDWEPWVYEGRWRVDCTRPTVSPSAPG
jgi:hypothetical protein